jgi:hypothetical protein
MPRRMSTENVDAMSTDAGWPTVLSDIQREMEELRKRLGDLALSEIIIRKKIATGEPFPGPLSMQN